MASDKIITVDKLKQLLSKLKTKKIVHCHGVFDLLHYGHINYFNEAKKNGDILIVSITSDKFVNKGSFRPYFNEKIRAKAISSLEIVDYVIINQSMTAVKMIHLLKPNYYVKGPDYRNTKDKNLNLEKNAINKVNGKIIFTSGKTFSSSNIINKSLEEFNTNQKLFLSKFKKKFSQNDIKQQLSKLANKKILIIGEAIIDEYVYCTPVGKSGKEPIMVNKKIKTERHAGGVITVANHLSNICKEIKIITYLGDQKSESNFIKKSLGRNISLEYIHKNNSPTIIKTRLVDNYSKNKITGLYDINDGELNTIEEKKIKNLIKRFIKKFDMVLVVDYGHGLLTNNIIKLIQQKSNFLSVNAQLNALNSSYHSIFKYKKADYLCIHEGELRHGFRDNTEKIDKLIKKLKQKIKYKKITITKGSNGSETFSNNKRVSCPAFATKILDRVGAGDTLLAITSICYLSNLPEELTLLAGNLAAANFISKMGTSSKINIDELTNSIIYLTK